MLCLALAARCAACGVVGLLLASTAWAQEVPPAAPAEPSPGIRRALIVAGHPGDAAHRQQFADTVESLQTSLVQRLGFPPEQVWVLFGGEEAAEDAPRPSSVRGPATSEALQGALAELQQALRPEDALWIVVLGHAHHDGRRVWLNLPGPDIDATSLGRACEPLACREQVFWITTAVSGYFLKPLAAPGRVAIAATEADLELNETTYPHVLAEVLAAPPAPADLDVDGDGQASLLDLHLTVVRRLLEGYASRMELATEHAQLDDNGDGRGTEVKIDFLPEELGGRPAGSPTITRPESSDGNASARLLPWTALPVSEP
jgi:hypothetical protein